MSTKAIIIAWSRSAVGTRTSTLRRIAHPLPNEPNRPINTLHLRLEAFEADLMEHMHLENNLLFLRIVPVV